MRKLVITEDGSHTLYVPELNEHYHSTFGAVQESTHIFINAGLACYHRKEINILEAGFGTGLNALLTLKYAEENDITILYHSYEKYPLTSEEVETLNYRNLLPEEYYPLFSKLHNAPWDKPSDITPRFVLYKHFDDFKAVNIFDPIDLVFFDAFNPDVQPDLWSEETLSGFTSPMVNDGYFLTYCVKGIVKQRLRRLGLKIERLPGPPGKREMLRGRKLPS